MRKCIRCKTDMIENLELLSSGSYSIDVKEKGLFKGSLGKVKCAVCKDCGYVETYIEDTNKIINLLKEDAKRI